MRRLTLALSTLLAFLLAAGAHAGAPSIAACSLAPLTDRHFPTLYEQASVVAIGTLTGATEDRIILNVEEGLAGAREGDRIPVSNRHFDIGADCSILESNHGFAYDEGQRVLAFLVPGDRETLWPGSFGRAIFAIDGNALRDATGAHPGAYGDLTLEAARDQVPSGTGLGGRDLTGVGSVLTMVLLAAVALIFWRRRQN